VNEIIRGLDGKREIGINKNQKKMKSNFNVLVINSLKSHDEEAKERSTSPNWCLKATAMDFTLEEFYAAILNLLSLLENFLRLPWIQSVGLLRSSMFELRSNLLHFISSLFLLGYKQFYYQKPL
jgi:hypothetical protein